MHPANLGNKLKKQMRLLLILIILSKSLNLFSQGDSIIFNNLIFKNGIYTSHEEILKNDPKYFNCKLEIEIGWVLGKSTYFYYDQASIKQPFEDPIFAISIDGKLLIKYKDQFCRLILKGPISTFFTEKIYKYSTVYTYTENKLYFLDLTSGTIHLLTPENIDWLFKRDSELYSTYSKVSEKKKKKTLYSYVLKYNHRNPLYIKIN